MRFKVTLSYDGKGFVGFQKQKEGRSVQECVELALSKINKSEISVRGSGRTDALVHAINQVLCFDSLVNMDESQYLKALNSFLPDDIYVKKVERVDDNFDPRHDATKKTYIYKINVGEYDVFNKDYIYQFNHPLNIKLMREAMKKFIGSHNFQNYCSNKEMYTYIREIFDFKLDVNNEILTFKITGSGFMRYMVRYIIGVIVNIGMERIDINFIDQTLDSLERKVISYKVPGCGLYLESVEYGK